MSGYKRSLPTLITVLLTGNFMQVVAHRGANREALENSWSAFQKAVEIGVDRIELDVQVTKDGHAVIYHDDSLIRIVGLPQRISSLTKDEIKQLRLPNGEPLPFLGDVVDEFLPQVELNIEIKGESLELCKSVERIIGKHPKRDKLIVSSFRQAPLNWFAKIGTDLRRAALWGRDTFRWPQLALLSPQLFMEVTGCQILHPEISLLDLRVMEQASRLGWTVIPWVPMNGEEAHREARWLKAKTLKVAGLCTNYPREFKEWLNYSDQTVNIIGGRAP